MHPASTVEAALRLGRAGVPASEIARRLGLPRRTVCDWLKGATPHVAACVAGCTVAHDFTALPPAYVYLLGLYLGDGSIATHPRGVYRLRFSLDTRYPAIIADCVSAIAAVAPQNRIGKVSHGTWIEVNCYSKSWPCLFPQHGPGKKHERRIVLADWQQALVDRWPHQLVRGLIHSDGCRFRNTGRGNWSNPRYSFTNHSADIRGIFCRTCDAIGVRWTTAHNTIYVSRKHDVERLDEFIGPKQ